MPTELLFATPKNKSGGKLTPAFLPIEIKKKLGIQSIHKDYKYDTTRKSKRKQIINTYSFSFIFTPLRSAGWATDRICGMQPGELVSLAQEKVLLGKQRKSQYQPEFWNTCTIRLTCSTCQYHLKLSCLDSRQHCAKIQVQKRVMWSDSFVFAWLGKGLGRDSDLDASFFSLALFYKRPMVHRCKGIYFNHRWWMNQLRDLPQAGVWQESVYIPQINT